jgi:deazaflavin-dependent oxidoreductase (nitroreductase family)
MAAPPSGIGRALEEDSDVSRYFTPTGKTLAWITKVHRALYRGTGGLIGSTVFQRAEAGDRWPLKAMHVLLLTTRGRKSGQPRTVPLPYFEYDGRMLVVGSFAGNDKDPAWLLNLRERADVELQIGRRRGAARATVLDDDARAHVWPQLATDWPRYQLYQDGTKRTIPLVELRWA